MVAVEYFSPTTRLSVEEELGARKLVPRNSARIKWVPVERITLSEADPLAVSCAWPRILKSSQYAASALQNRTKPGETGVPEAETEALRVTSVPAATVLPGEIVNSVVVGEGVAATASAALKKPTASTRPKETGEKQRLLFKGETSEEA